MKVVEQDKAQMVDALHARRKSAVTGLPPVLPVSAGTPGDDKQDDGSESPENWVKFDKPILWMVAGKGPYASRCVALALFFDHCLKLLLRSLMQFPVSHPDDGLIDMSIQEVVRIILRNRFFWFLTWYLRLVGSSCSMEWRGPSSVVPIGSAPCVY